MFLGSAFKMAVNCARAFSKSPLAGRGSQRVLHVRAIGKSLGQVLESRDGLLVVFHEYAWLASMRYLSPMEAAG